MNRFIFALHRAAGDIGSVMSALNRRSENFLGHFAEIVTRSLCKGGIERASAEVIALDALDAVRREFGGDQFYISKLRVNVEDRQAEVHALWQGGVAVPDIAEQLGCTPRWVYSLVSKERLRLRDRRKRAAC